MTDQQLTDQVGATDAAIIGAAREELIRYGIRRANMSEIARRASVSRVTVYRRFASKAGLFRAVVMADVLRFAETFDAIWYGSAPVAERMVEILAHTGGELRAHPLLTTLMASEPETVALIFTSDSTAEFQMMSALMSKRLDDLVERGELRAIDTHRVGETLLRLSYTIVLIPSGDVPGHNHEDIQRFVNAVVRPILGLT